MGSEYVRPTLSNYAGRTDTVMTEASRYRWFQLGDLNAFFALFLDNIVNLVFLATILAGFGFPVDIIYKYMVPGTALGVMFGDLVYTWFAFRLARQTGKNEITAMPLGLDTPSTVGVALAVLGPAFLMFQGQGMDANAAAMATWKVGMGVMLIMGLVKLVTAFLGPVIQKVVPAAGLLGSLAGIGIVWLAANSLIEIYALPFVGLLALGIILFTLIARFEFPFNLPGAAVAVVLGCLIYYGMGFFGLLGGHFHWPSVEHVSLAFPVPTGAAFAGIAPALNFLPVAIPFGLLTIIGGINVTEGARLVGDNYKTRDILLTEAVATLLAGVCGGVAQSTPYIGHSAYKKMGARAGYTLATGLAVGFGAWFGLVQFIVDLIPKAAVAPILVFVGFEIVVLAFHQSPRRHAMAVVFAIVPSVLNFGFVKLNVLYEHVQRMQSTLTIMADRIQYELPGAQSAELSRQVAMLIPPFVSAEYPVFLALGQGFILTAMIWGACVAFLIDRQIWRAALAMVSGAVCAFFGLIHSVFASGDLYLPWTLVEFARSKGVVLAERSLLIPYEFALAYLGLAAVIPAMYFFGPAKNDRRPLPDD